MIMHRFQTDPVEVDHKRRRLLRYTRMSAFLEAVLFLGITLFLLVEFRFFS